MFSEGKQLLIVFSNDYLMKILQADVLQKTSNYFSCDSISSSNFFHQAYDFWTHSSVRGFSYFKSVRPSNCKYFVRIGSLHFIIFAIKIGFNKHLKVRKILIVPKMGIQCKMLLTGALCLYKKQQQKYIQIEMIF